MAQRARAKSIKHEPWEPHVTVLSTKDCDTPEGMRIYWFNEYTGRTAVLNAAIIANQAIGRMIAGTYKGR